MHTILKHYRMPAHRRLFEQSIKAKAVQKLIQYYINNEFWLFVEGQFATKTLTTLEKYTIAKDDIYTTYHRITDIQQVFETMRSIRTKLNGLTTLEKTIESTILHGEWNYLGKQIEREQFLDKISELFWLHQDKEELQNHEKFQEFVEYPWKILQSGADFSFNIPVPSDFFDSSTDKFIESLMHALHTWELNPYLIVDNKSNLQWQIQINNNLVINGYVIKENNGELIHITKIYT